MDKRSLILLVILIIVIIAGVVIVLVRGNKTQKNVNTTDIVEQSEPTDNGIINNEEETSSTGGKILVVYFSAQNHTETVAKQIAENLSADIFEITPVQEYTTEDLSWSSENSRVKKEHDDESLRNVELTKTDVDNWENYDTILLGYPIWWGIAAWPVDTFVKANDFTGKTVIPFCTSSSSEIGQSGELLKEEAGTGNWQEGKRFQSSASETVIKEWTDSLNIE